MVYKCVYLYQYKTRFGLNAEALVFVILSIAKDLYTASGCIKKFPLV